MGASCWRPSPPVPAWSSTAMRGWSCWATPSSSWPPACTCSGDSPAHMKVGMARGQIPWEQLCCIDSAAVGQNVALAGQRQDVTSPAACSDHSHCPAGWLTQVIIMALFAFRSISHLPFVSVPCRPAHLPHELSSLHPSFHTLIDRFLVSPCVACRPADQPQDPHHLQCQPDPSGQPARPDGLHAQRLQAGGLCIPGGGPCGAWPGRDAYLVHQAWLGPNVASVTACPGKACEGPALQAGLPGAFCARRGKNVPSTSGMPMLSTSQAGALHVGGLLSGQGSPPMAPVQLQLQRCTVYTLSSP